MLSSNPSSASNYVDFSGFADLARRARQQDATAKDVVARQFEALLIQQMLTQMRQASVATEDSMLGQAGAMYQDLLDKQFALQVSEAGGMGLSRYIANGMSPSQAIDPSATVPHSESERALKLPHIPSHDERLAAATRTLERVQDSLQALSEDPYNEGLSPDAGIAALPALSDRGDRPDSGMDFSSSDDFVRRLRGAATRAASALGVAPGVLLAQAALESGWGRHIPEARDGRSSHNLFGIKAGPAWKGPTVEVDTKEYRNGRMVTERASFRAYESFGDSFADYVNFLRSNPRYQDALAKTHSASGFMHGLQKAGYATDPRYAAKVTAVMRGAAFDGLGKVQR